MQATGYDLEQAVGLYFAQQADEGSAAHAKKAATGPSQPDALQSGCTCPCTIISLSHFTFLQSVHGVVQWLCNRTHQVLHTPSSVLLPPVPFLTTSHALAPEEPACSTQASSALVCASSSSISPSAELCRGLSFDTPDGAEVRAPLPAMRDRLYGADMSMLGRPRGQSRREPSQVDAFRDFRYACAYTTLLDGLGRSRVILQRAYVICHSSACSTYVKTSRPWCVCGANSCP